MRLGTSVDVRAAVEFIFDTAKLNSTKYRQTYLVALQILKMEDEEQLQEQPIYDELVAHFRREDICYVHNFSTDRFWREKPKMRRLLYTSESAPGSTSVSAPASTSVSAPASASVSAPASTSVSAPASNSASTCRPAATSQSPSFNGRRSTFNWRSRWWSPTETAMLLAGVRVHGSGSWRQILQDTRLSFQAGRTQQQLRRKYQSLVQGDANPNSPSVYHLSAYEPDVLNIVARLNTDQT